MPVGVCDGVPIHTFFLTSNVLRPFVHSLRIDTAACVTHGQHAHLEPASFFPDASMCHGD